MNILQGLSYDEIQGLNKSLLGDDGSFAITPNGVNKAFSAGEGTGSDMTDLDTLTGGRAITVENIDTDLKVTAEARQDLVWWNLLRNKPIYAVLDQYMVLSDHGTSAKRHVFGKFRTESAFPKTGDVTLERKVDSTKFIRDMRDLTHVADTVSTMAEKHGIINRAGAMTVLEAIELATMFGNSDAMPTQFDGMYKKALDAYNAGYTNAVIDNRSTGSSSASKGGEITEERLEKGSENILNALGRASHMVMPTKVKADLNAILPNSRRVNMGGGNAGLNNLLLGMPSGGFRSDFAWNGWGKGAEAHFRFESSIDVFFPSGESADVKAPAADYPNSTDAPAEPTSVEGAAASLSTSKFGAGDAGSYWYKVSAYNADGVSVATSIASALAIAAGEKATLTITCNDSTITGLSIYRSAMDAATAADCRWIADIAVTNAVSTTTFVDYNLMLPGTSQSMLISNAPQSDAIDYRQLMPFVRMPLPFGLNNIVGYPYLYMLYSYLRTPKFINARTGYCYHVLYSNIRYSESTF